MQVLKGKLIQVDVNTPKPDKVTGQIKDPYVSLSVLSTFTSFGKAKPDVVNVSVPLAHKNEYEKMLNKDIEISVLFPKPQYNLTSV